MKSLQFNLRFEDIKPINSEFSFCKAYTLYTGFNRNNSFISKQTVIDSLSGLYNIPIVGEYLEKTDNFGGHGGKLEITSEGIKYIQTTKALGVVPESAEVYWENVTESDGSINEYLVIDKAILWTGKFTEVDGLMDKKFGQSMEIEVNSGEFIDMDGVQTYEIKSFTWSALCILGIEIDGKGEVTPCFESASIAGYSLDKEKFKSEFAQMLKELKFSMQQNVIPVAEEVIKEGGTNLDKILELLSKYSLTIEDLQAKEIVAENFSIEDLEVKIQETFGEEKKEIFSWSSEQLEDELRRIVRLKKTIDSWGYECADYYYVDHLPDEKVVIVYDYDDRTNLGFDYTISVDLVTINMDVETRYKSEWVKMNLAPETEIDDNVSFMPDDAMEYSLKVKEAELTQKFEAEKEIITNEATIAFEKLQSDFNALKEEFSALELKATHSDSELSAKLQQEREDAENAIFESFSKELTEDEMAPIKSKKSEMSLEDIEDKLFSLAGRKNVKFSKTVEKPQFSRMSVDINNEEEKDDKSKSKSVFARLKNKKYN